MVNEGKKQVLDLLNDNNLIDFFLFYIQHTLVSLNLSNTVSLVTQILTLIARHGNSLYWSKYRDLIAKITNLDPEDLNVTYKKLVTSRFAVRDDSVYKELRDETAKVKSENEKNLKESWILCS